MLMETMSPRPQPGDICRIRYTGYHPNGDDRDDSGHKLPPKEGVGEYIRTDAWGGGRWQRVFQFSWGEEAIYDDHEIFECKIIRCPQHPEMKAGLVGDYVACRQCGRMLDSAVNINPVLDTWSVSESSSALPSETITCPESFIHISTPPYVSPTCAECGSELAIQMIEHPSGYVCLKCNPPEIRYVPIAEYQEAKACLQIVLDRWQQNPGLGEPPVAKRIQAILEKK